MRSTRGARRSRSPRAGTVFLGAVMLVLGPARKNAVLILTFAGGGALWAASLAGWLEPLPEAVTSAAGSLTLAGALLQSARVCHACACSVCADEQHADQGKASRLPLP